MELDRLKNQHLILPCCYFRFISILDFLLILHLAFVPRNFPFQSAPLDAKIWSRAKSVPRERYEKNTYC